MCNPGGIPFSSHVLLRNETLLIIGGLLSTGPAGRSERFNLSMLVSATPQQPANPSADV